MSDSSKGVDIQVCEALLNILEGLDGSNAIAQFELGIHKASLSNYLKTPESLGISKEPCIKAARELSKHNAVVVEDVRKAIYYIAENFEYLDEYDEYA